MDLKDAILILRTRITPYKVVKTLESSDHFIFLSNPKAMDNGIMISKKDGKMMPYKPFLLSKEEFQTIKELPFKNSEVIK